MPSYEIRGYQVQFPHDAYPCQVMQSSSFQSESFTVVFRGGKVSEEHLESLILDPTSSHCELCGLGCSFVYLSGHLEHLSSVFQA